MLTFERVHFAKFHFHRSVFLQNTGLGTDILFTIKSYIARSLVKKNQYPTGICLLPKWTKWYAMTSHVIAYRSLELLFGTHTFHFNCFFEDFNCVFTQIRCLSRVLLDYEYLSAKTNKKNDIIFDKQSPESPVGKTIDLR